LQQLKATYFDLDSSFDLPNPVPPDLTLKFSDFVALPWFAARSNLARARATS